MEYHIAISEKTITRKKNIDKSHKYISTNGISHNTCILFVHSMLLEIKMVGYFPITGQVVTGTDQE